MPEYLCILLAIAFHGAGHLAAARICGMQAKGIIPTPTGLRLMLAKSAFPSYDVELCAALGGPLGNLLGNAVLIVLQMLLPLAPLRDICRETLPLSLFLGIWNLLPIEGFDGGRVLQCLLLRGRKRNAITPDAVEGWLRLTSGACFLGLWVLSVYLLLRTGRALSLFLFCLQLFWGLFGEQFTSHARYGE